MYCQTFSVGLSSGHLGGSTRSVMLCGTERRVERGHPAWSRTSTACLPGATSVAISARGRFISSLWQAGRTSAAPLPSLGGHNLVVEAGKAPLVLGDELRVERRLPIARDLELNPAGLGHHGLPAITVAAVAGIVSRKMVVHLSVQRSLCQDPLQIVQKTIGVERRLQVRARQELRPDVRL